MEHLRDYFVHHPDESWEPRQPITMGRPECSLVLMPGQRFRRRQFYLGVDVAGLCEMDETEWSAQPAPDSR